MITISHRRHRPVNQDREYWGTWGKTGSCGCHGGVPWIGPFRRYAGELYTALLWVKLNRFMQPLVIATSRVVHSVGNMWYIF